MELAYKSVNGWNYYKPDLNKVAAVPQPKTAQEVCWFLGMCNYLSCFMLTLLKTSEPLNHLIEDGVEVWWSEADMKTFNDLKWL